MTGQDMLKRVLPRMAKQQDGSGVSFIDSLNTAIGLIASRLWERRSELVKATMELDADADPFSLPPDFRGMAEDPFLVSATGNTSGLTPLPTGALADYYGKTGVPKHYRLYGDKIQVFPAPNAEYLVNGEYFAHPKDVALTSAIPWFGLFDKVIEDAVVRIAVAGDAAAVLADAGFREEMAQEVDSVLNSRTNPAPRRSTARFL